MLLAIRANFDPATGPTRLIFGFEAVIIGGLSSFWGTLAGGDHSRRRAERRLGRSIPACRCSPAIVAFLIVLAIRPYGLFGRPA